MLLTFSSFLRLKLKDNQEHKGMLTWFKTAAGNIVSEGNQAAEGESSETKGESAK